MEGPPVTVKTGGFLVGLPEAATTACAAAAAAAAATEPLFTTAGNINEIKYRKILKFFP